MIHKGGFTKIFQDILGYNQFLVFLIFLESLVTITLCYEINIHYVINKYSYMLFFRNQLLILFSMLFSTIILPRLALCTNNNYHVRLRVNYYYGGNNYYMYGYNYHKEEMNRFNPFTFIYSRLINLDFPIKRKKLLQELSYT